MSRHGKNAVDDNTVLHSRNALQSPVELLRALVEHILERHCFTPLHLSPEEQNGADSSWCQRLVHYYEQAVHLSLARFNEDPSEPPDSASASFQKILDYCVSRGDGRSAYQVQRWASQISENFKNEPGENTPPVADLLHIFLTLVDLQQEEERPLEEDPQNTETTKDEKNSTDRNFFESESLMDSDTNRSNRENEGILSSQFQAPPRSHPQLPTTSSSEKRREKKSPPADQSLILSSSQGVPSTLIVQDMALYCGVNELALLREVLFACQGIDGLLIQFNEEADVYLLRQDVPCSPAIRTLVARIGRLGVLYRRLQTYLKEIRDTQTSDSSDHQSRKDQGGSLVNLAFLQAVENSLSEYYSLLAAYEEQIHHIDYHQTRHEGRSNVAPLSLRRLLVHLQEPYEWMRVWVAAADGARRLQGGPFLSFLHLHCHRGDTTAATLFENLLDRASRPIDTMMSEWMSTGDLSDPFEEFFVEKCSTQPTTDQNDFQTMWFTAYRMNEGKIPGYISKDLARRVFETGKARAFERSLASVALRRERAGATSIDLPPLSLTASSCLKSLKCAERVERLDEEEKQIGPAAQKRIADCIIHRCGVMKIVFAAKQFLFLCQGDFGAALLELVGDELAQSPSRVRLHFLRTCLHSALRSSNFQHFPPGVVSRMDCNFLPSASAESGWDLFTLDFLVGSEPLNVVLNPTTLGIYRKIFAVLWAIRRVHVSLTHAWAFDLHCAYLDRNIALWPTLHKCRSLRREMFHFLSNLDTYIILDVVDEAWRKFEGDTACGLDLDSFIEAHQAYLFQIQSGVFLPSDDEAGDGADTGVMRAIYSRMMSMMDLILHFINIVGGIYDAAYDYDSANPRTTHVPVRGEVEEFSDSESTSSYSARRPQTTTGQNSMTPRLTELRRRSLTPPPKPPTTPFGLFLTRRSNVLQTDIFDGKDLDELSRIRVSFCHQVKDFMRLLRRLFTLRKDAPIGALLTRLDYNEFYRSSREIPGDNS